MNLRFVTLFLLMALSSTQQGAPRSSFKSQQLRFERVREASKLKEAPLRNLFSQHRLSYPPARLLLRAFKREQLLEVWAGGPGDAALTHIRDYRFCAMSGTLGPKRRQGDSQIPEGFYAVDRFNPQSNFHLSLGLNYPNASDRILGGRSNLGGDIFIHGGCATIGCIPITDEGIRELYLMAVEVRSASAAPIQVHILPARLDSRGMTKLRADYAGDPGLLEFWSNLQTGFDLFEKTRRAPTFTVERTGRYRFAD